MECEHAQQDTGLSVTHPLAIFSFWSSLSWNPKTRTALHTSKRTTSLHTVVRHEQPSLYSYICVSEKWQNAARDVQHLSVLTLSPLSPCWPFTPWGPVGPTGPTSPWQTTTSINVIFVTKQRTTTTKLFTLNDTLWTDIKEVPFAGAFGPSSKANERKS